MKRQLALLMTLATLAIVESSMGLADSWIFRRSAYSHDPVTRERAIQFAQGEPALSRVDPTYMESAYRQNHISIPGANGGADNLHIVQTWGAGEWIRPYGEWEYPFRAGATPYGPWGNPQGPWTAPFESWLNPYGLGQLPRPPWPFWPYPAGPVGPSLPVSPTPLPAPAPSPTPGVAP